MMTEAEFFERVLGIKEIRVDRIDWQEQSLHVYCSSIFEEALCPHCLNKRQVVHQTYERQFRDLSITGKEVYLHLSQRQVVVQTPYWGKAASLWPLCPSRGSERLHFVNFKQRVLLSFT